MADVVLDASAVLAFLLLEPGAERVADLIVDARILSVNAAEIISKLVERGIASGEATSWLMALPCQFVAADIDLALHAGSLRVQTRQLGLSLGDRFCLALAMCEKLPVVTADRAWSELAIGVDIRLIR